MQPIRQYSASTLSIFLKFCVLQDYVGQKLADDIYHVVLTVAGIISFICAYIYQRYSYASYGTIAGFVLASVVSCNLKKVIARKS